jgi:putative phosphoesterase
MAVKISPTGRFTIGIISDTHGHIPPGLPDAFKNVDHIIHAGDIGDDRVLTRLAKIAPVTAVRGNMDFGKWTEKLPENETIEIGGKILIVLHIASHLNIDPQKAGCKAVISGHTHRPDVYEKGGVIFINPGSASYPKFGQPGSAALVTIKGARFSVEIIRLTN